MDDFDWESFRADQMNMIAGAADATTQANDDVMVNSQPVKRRRSEVWDYFIELKDANGKRCGADCKACGRNYKITSGNGTAPLRAHLKRCPKKRNVDGEEHSEMTTSTFEEMSKKEKCPRQSLDSKDLLEHLEKYTPGLQLRGDLRPVIFRNYGEEKERLLTYLNRQSCRFNLSINLLAPCFGPQYVCLILQFIDDDWKLKKKVLAIKSYSDCKELDTTILNVLSDWNSIVQKRVCCITSEDTKEADMIVRKIKIQLDRQQALPLAGKWSHIYCFSNFFNHLIEAGMLEVNVIYWKIWTCISYVCYRPADVDESSLPVVDRVRSQIKEVNLEDTAISSKVDLQILGRMLSLKDGFSQLEIADVKFKEFNLQEEDWNKATLIYQELKEFDNEIRRLTVRKFLTANVYFPAVCSIYCYLCKWEKDLRLNLMTNNMKQIFSKYWQSSIGGLAIAIILDPRLKLHFVRSRFEEIFSDDAKNQINTVENIFKEVYEQYAGGDETGCFGTLGSWGIPFKETEDKWSKKPELNRYLEEMPLSTVYTDLDVVGWWGLHKPHFPRLAKMARDFLAIPMSAALSNLSLNNDVKKIVAASIDLDPDIIQQIICLKDWSSTA